MLSENDYKAIETSVRKRLEQDCAYSNQEVNLRELLPAIAKAIMEAFKQYDQMR